MAHNSYKDRKAPRIHEISNYAGDLHSDIGSVEFTTYTVHIPPTPDNQPMEISIASPSSQNTIDRTCMSNSMFTGGHNRAIRAHSKGKMIESQTSHSQMAATDGSFYEVPASDADGSGSGVDLYPCECEHEAWRDYDRDEEGVCPGCQKPYSRHDMPSLDRRLTWVKSNNAFAKGQSADDFASQFLFESTKNYGYGNAIWPSDSTRGNDEEISDNLKVFSEKNRKPLTQRVNISAAIIAPYRILIFVRMIVLGLFLYWRVTNPNEEAIWLWGMSVVCEIWFAFSWLLDQLPKLCPINRAADVAVLKETFETPTPSNPTGISDLPGIDIFVSTADPEKEPPLVTANTILSILAADYPVEKLSCYVSDDGGALLTFEAMAEAASFASLWVPFCRKHQIEPRNPESYFSLKKDPYKNKVRPDFVRDRRRVKREYDEFKVRINGLSDSIRRRSDAYNIQAEVKAMKKWKEESEDEPMGKLNIVKATWMSDGTHWPGTWTVPAPEHSRGDHASIIQVMLLPPRDEPLNGTVHDGQSMDLSEVDIRLPMLVYITREKRPGYDHNKKAGAMNALVRASAVMSNGPFILNLDCDHYIYNSQALREGMCYMMDRGGDNICYVQFPQRFEGIDPSDRYANHNIVFFDVNMRALDGIQGPVYVGTGCLFRRIAVYGFDPSHFEEQSSYCSCCFVRRKKIVTVSVPGKNKDDEEINFALIPKKFGNSSEFVSTIAKAAFDGLPLAEGPTAKNGRPPGALCIPRKPLDPSSIAEAVNIISCWYEDKTEWGQHVGWVYGSVTEDVVTGYKMHQRGWKSIYCMTNKDAFRGTAPINLTDRLHQVLRWATGSVEIFFSRNNALLGGHRLKLLQRIAYLNVGIYPFTSIFLIVYCFLPALSLFSNQFIVDSLSVNFLVYLLMITSTLCILAILEIKWAGIAVEDWWRNEQFWLIGGTSAHLAAVLQGLLKVIAGIDISFTLTSKSAGDDGDDEFADLYIVKWTSLMIPPCTIIMVNLIAIAVGICRTIYSNTPQWSNLVGGVFFSFWVLAHLYPFAKGLMGRRGKTPTIVFVWSGLISISISLLWVAIDPPSGDNQIGGLFQLL
ncbi:cellulose synthase-like protein D3 [Ricinus communis]|uniref:cellulose synthase-like protein D3 n=1 Tax=Ricinus communis TaxID=3988 RepID=UPI00201ABFCE|nr:cellulose synthase-like protein D3 [Ricinus communis]XP_015574517.2 cellulose synthase-like protein D3 [Ricinus communis]XP_015574518.2 cellulose synthase-like protein D3 [Ricinus communis]